MTMLRSSSRQPSHNVIDVADWALDEDFPVYPTGSKPKRLLISHVDETFPFVAKRQGYLFKVAQGWQAQQMWSEILAYELSFAFNVKVPPALAAIDSKTGESGALIELFYRYPRPTARLVHAADYMQDHFTAGKRGRPHAVRENLALCRALKVPDFYEWWAKALLFDSLLGNVDRHPENWGFIFERTAEVNSVGLAPLYDNGTSLGYNILEERLDPPWTSAEMEQFVKKGKHDCGWSHKEDGPMLNIELCRRFFTTFPQYVPMGKEMLNTERDAIEEVLDWAQEFDTPLRISPARARFIVDQITARQRLLREALEE